MQAVSISALTHNPAQAPRQAKQGPVLVLNRDNPDALFDRPGDRRPVEGPGRVRRGGHRPVP
ncbi:MAG: hypothetical protein ACK46L_05890 [Synechococcaceae cyanobacterium]